MSHRPSQSSDASIKVIPLKKASDEKVRTGATNNTNADVRNAAGNPFDLSSICGQPNRLNRCVMRFRATIRDDTAANAMADVHRYTAGVNRSPPHRPAINRHAQANKISIACAARFSNRSHNPAMKTSDSASSSDHEPQPAAVAAKFRVSVESAFSGSASIIPTRTQYRLSDARKTSSKSVTTRSTPGHPV